MKAVGRAAATYSSVPTIMIPDPQAAGLDLPDRQTMLTMDPPLHGRFRRLLSHRFTPRPVERLLEMFQYAAGVMEAKRKSPCDDLSSLLVGAELDGRKLDAIDFNLMFMLIVDAGGDTTRNLVAGGMQALFDHPDQRRRLQADLDGLLESAGEEMLRLISPVVYMHRTVKRPTQLRDVKLEPGDKVVIYYGAANRDESVFAEPGRFGVARDPNERVAFGGGGPHYCLGSHVARIEIQAMLREIEPTAPAEWLPSVFISGPKHMPVRFTPGRRLGAAGR